MRLAFTIEGPPVGKERSRSTRAGHHFTPAKTRDYEARAKLCALRAAGLVPGWLVDGAFSLTLRVYFGDRRRRDLDNVVKSVADGMNGAGYLDDSQIAELHAYRGYDKANPRVEVVLELLAA